MKYLLNVILLLNLFLINSFSQDFVPKDGDLLFQDGDCGDLCEAIETVTPGYRGAKFSHMGMLISDSSGIWVIESIQRGTVLTPLDTFLNRSLDFEGHPKVMVGRLKKQYQYLIKNAIVNAKSRLNTAYDNEYLFTNSTLYCSELIYESFADSLQSHLFQAKPMTFKDPKTGNFFPGWVEYYKSLGMDIPEGEPGINPGLISISPKIEIIYNYGIPDGYQGK